MRPTGLPIYDWLCALSDQGRMLTCRQRDPNSTARFVFERVGRGETG